MPRAPTTLDPFNAVAEPKRRRVLEVLAEGERPVNDLVESLQWPQPQVSKHLGVLKKVGLVSVRQVRPDWPPTAAALGWRSARSRTISYSWRSTRSSRSESRAPSIVGR